MGDAFHNYAIEWYKDSIIATVDGVQYYTYDKTANAYEWPFDRPQALIVNLAIGGGWGGAKGVDPDMTEQQLIVDYVRVYAKKWESNSRDKTRKYNESTTYVFRTNTL